MPFTRVNHNLTMVPLGMAPGGLSLDGDDQIIYIPLSGVVRLNDLLLA